MPKRTNQQLVNDAAVLVGTHGWHNVFYALATVAGEMNTKTTNQLEHDLNQMGNTYHEIVTGRREGMGTDYTRDRCMGDCIVCNPARANFRR